MFQQILAPVGGSLALSALVAVCPLVLLLVLLGVVRMRADRAALVSLLTVLVIAVAVYGLPVSTALSGTAEGIAFGLVPIVWIMINAVFLNRLLEESGHLRWVRHAFMRLSDDVRVQAVVVAFCFGSLLEAMAGFGAPIVVVAAILLALGFSPARSATVALFADAAGTAFGSVGNPIFALNKITGLPVDDLGAMVGRQAPFMALLVPFVLLGVLDGLRGVRQLWPVALTVGAGFGLGQFLASNYIAFQLADLIGALVAFGAAAAVLRAWTPREIHRITGSDEGPTTEPSGGTPAPTGPDGGVRVRPQGALLTTERSGAATALDDETPTRAQTARAFAPYAVLTVLLAVVSLDGPIQRAVKSVKTSVHWPGVDVVSSSGEPLSLASFKIAWFGETGSVLLITALISMVILRVGVRDAVRQYGRAAAQIRVAATTVVLVVAFAYVFNLSGQATTIGVLLSGAGAAFVALSPVLGWLGVAASGSDTSSNALFAAVQVASAQRIGVSPYLLAAANSEAGALGKLVSPQNIAVACAAVGLSGREGWLLRRSFPWSLLFLGVFIVVLLLMAFGPLAPLVIW
jgi:lactate permease